MFEAFAIPVSWSEILKRTVRDSIDDDVMGLAAQLAYYFFLSLFPAVLFLLALASFFPLTDLSGNLTRMLAPVATPAVLEIIKDQLARLAQADSGGLLTFGAVAALWSSSAAIVAIVGAMNRAYDIEDTRPWWKVRLISIGLTLVLALFVLVSLTLILVGPTLAEHLARSLGLGAAFQWTWNVVQWPFALFLVSFGIGLVYYLAPDAEQDWVWVTPGALLATLLWLVASLGFKYYVANFTNYNAAYGTVGGVIVLMLWFYVSSLVLLAGAELNAEIEHLSPHGKEPGARVPGKRPVIGVRAARAYRERQAQLASPGAA